jgi:undecaprenyl-diphosphatase
LITALAVRRHRVGPHETMAFRAVNDLPDSLYRPAWLVMQLGALGAAPAAAGAAWLSGDHELAGRLLADGTGTWALAKLVKQLVRRPRPAALLPGTRCRGSQATGLGYLSGHAGVAAALGAAALPHLGRTGRVLTLVAVPVVGLTRIYTGAHLPLDIAGGAALGLRLTRRWPWPASRGQPSVRQAQGPAMMGRAPLPIIPGRAQPWLRGSSSPGTRQDMRKEWADARRRHTGSRSPGQAYRGPSALPRLEPRATRGPGGPS